MRELESLSYSRSVITVCLSISGWINLYLSTIFVDQCLYSIGSTTVISTLVAEPVSRRAFHF